MNFLKSSLVAAAICAAPVTASATILDFTTLSTFDSISSSGASGSGLGYTFTLTTNPADQLTFAESVTGPTCAMLACEFDGLGVTDDEITTNGITQSITITFDREVVLTGLFFLDLFISPDQSSIEEAELSIDGGATINPGLVALEVFDNGATTSGFAYYSGLSYSGTSFTFTSSNTNDNIGFADYALAGIQVAAVPLPAGMLLLGGALGALGFARRRKAVATA